MLYRIAKNAGARIRFGCPVASVDPEAPSATLANGKKVYGDIIIGADGDKSVVRKALDGGDDEEDDDIYTTYLYVKQATYTTSVKLSLQIHCDKVADG